MRFAPVLFKRCLPNLPKFTPKMPYSAAKLYWHKENMRLLLIMGKQVKRIVNLTFAAIGLAMGVAVVVMTAINAEITTTELVRLLAIGVASLGVFALNNIHL